MKVTARDVARVAGVSPAAVSIVFRNRPGVSDATRAHVREVADRIGFEYAGTAEAPRTSTLQLIVFKRHGKVVSDTPFFERLTKGVSDETYRQGYHRLAISYYYATEHASEQLKSLRTTKCAGIVLLATEMLASDVSQFERLGVPIVLLDSWFPSRQLDAVVIDNQRGAWGAVQYLAKRGHKQIGYLHSNVDIRNFLERRDGYLGAVGALGLEARPEWCVRVGTTITEAYDDMSAWLEGISAGGATARSIDDAAGSAGRAGGAGTAGIGADGAMTSALPTAFFADNDIIAAGCMRALLHAGYRVPEDVSVVGFDDMPLAELCEPPLSTMAVPKESMGALAVKRLVELVRDGGQHEVVRISVLPEIVSRESVSEPRA